MENPLSYGISLVRSAYRHFWFKEQVQAANLEHFTRYSLGSDMAEPMPTPGEAFVIDRRELLFPRNVPENVQRAVSEYGLSLLYAHTRFDDSRERTHIIYQEPRHRNNIPEAIDISQDDIAAGLLRAWGESPFDEGVKGLFSDRLEEIGHGEAAERVRQFDVRVGHGLSKWCQDQNAGESAYGISVFKDRFAKDWKANLAALFGHVWCQRCKKAEHLERFNDVPNGQSWMYCSDCTKEVEELWKHNLPPTLYGIPVKITDHL